MLKIVITKIVALIRKEISVSKYFLFLLILSFSVTSISCSKKSEIPEIEFWTLQLSPTFNSYFNNLISDYEKQNPGIKIKWVDIPYDAAIQKLLAAVSAGNPPDVVNLSSDFLAKFNSFNTLYDFTETIRYDSLKNIYLDNALATGTFNNKVVALPWYLNTYCILYNKELLASAGMNTVPATFDEAIPFIKEYKDRTGKFAFFWNIGKDSFLPMMLESEGLPMTDESFSKALFNSKAAKEKIETWVQLYKEGYLPVGSVINSASSVIESYQSGKVAMVFTGPVFLNQVKTNSPSVYNVTGVAPPLLGQTGKHELAAMSISVMKQSKHLREAARFAKFVTNSKNQTEFCRIETIYPSTKESMKDEYYLNDEGTLESYARVMGAKLLPDAARLRNYLLHPKFDLLKDIFEEAIQKSCLSGVPIEESLDNAARLWNDILRDKDL
jgi:putative chitobiose transport system substrate-binding protein